MIDYMSIEERMSKLDKEKSYFIMRCPVEEKQRRSGFWEKLKISLRPHSFLGKFKYNDKYRDEFCDTCGAVLEKKYVGINCHECGTYYASKRKFCQKCGVQLREPNFDWAHFTVECDF